MLLVKFEMPGRLKVKILSGRHLPIMDRASEMTDAFVEVKFGSVTYKTDVCFKSLNPSWNSEWFVFEVDDEQLQDEPLQVRVLDHDTYSSHDSIGKVYVDIDPLLSADSTNALHGWFPLYDTLHGIRGEVQLTVQLELFADFNQFKKSSCGVSFLCGTVVPECYKISAIQGFVEELVVSEDPVYQWIDKLRTPRATNEARQRLFFQVSGELQRRIGQKVREMGGNAVVGYRQTFDIEGEYGLVVRAIGTAATLSLIHKMFFSSPQSTTQNSPKSCSPNDMISLPKKDTPFFTLTEYPPNFLVHLGGFVSSHSIKLLDKIHYPDEPETRDSWWQELRLEINSHASALHCNAVVGYKESTSICNELILLSAQGTAAVVDENIFTSNNDEDIASSEEIESELNTTTSDGAYRHASVERPTRQYRCNECTAIPSWSDACAHLDPSRSNMNLFQVPYCFDVPFPISVGISPLSSSLQVPKILFTSIDVPKDVHVTGGGTLIQARFCRSKKKSQGESHAAVVGDIVPFVEYELHKQLHNKVKLHGMNALFGLQTQIHVGENMIVGIAVATGVDITALPKSMCVDVPGPVSDIARSALECSDQQLEEKVPKSKESSSLLHTPVLTADQTSGKRSTGAGHLIFSLESTQSLPVKGEISDNTEQMQNMISPLPPSACSASKCQLAPGIIKMSCITQMFCMFWRVRYRDRAGDDALNQGLNIVCEKMLANMWQRLARLSSKFCVLGVEMNMIVSEDDEIHIWLSGSTAEYKSARLRRWDLRKSEMFDDNQFLANINGFSGKKLSDRKHLTSKSNEMDRDLLLLPALQNRVCNSTSSAESPLTACIVNTTNCSNYNCIGARSNRYRHVEIISTSHIPGGHIDQHIGFVNLFFIRETSAVRGGDDGLPGTEPAKGTGLCWFAHTVFAEVQAMLRAHVIALGGNALTSYRMEQFSLSENIMRNQASCLIHVCGDAVIHSY